MGVQRWIHPIRAIVAQASKGDAPRAEPDCHAQLSGSPTEQGPPARQEYLACAREYGSPHSNVRSSPNHARTRRVWFLTSFGQVHRVDDHDGRVRIRNGTTK